MLSARRRCCSCGGITDRLFMRLMPHAYHTGQEPTSEGLPRKDSSVCLCQVTVMPVWPMNWSIYILREKPWMGEENPIWRDGSR